MAYHRNIEGLKCSFEQCKVRSKKLVDIREHVRQAHSVKNPTFATHFTNEYSLKPVLSEINEKEPNLESIYECLDEQLDKDVLGDKHQKKHVLINRKNVQDFFNELDSIKKEVGESNPPPPTMKTRSASVRKSPIKRKRPSDKLIVKIRNKREKMNKDPEDPDYEVEEDEDDEDHEIKKELL